MLPDSDEDIENLIRYSICHWTLVKVQSANRDIIREISTLSSIGNSVNWSLHSWILFIICVVHAVRFSLFWFLLTNGTFTGRGDSWRICCAEWKKPQRDSSWMETQENWAFGVHCSCYLLPHACCKIMISHINSICLHKFVPLRHISIAHLVNLLPSA